MHHIIFLLMAGLYQLCTGAPEAIPGYKMTPNKYCYVKNEGGQIYGLMLQECADKCNNLAGCVSFEFFTDLLDAGHVGETLCQPSTTCTLDISVDFPHESTRGPIYFYSVDLQSVPGYTMTPNKYCYVKNEGGQLYGLALQECVDTCNNLAGCVSFEFFTDLLDAGHVGETLCQPSTTCTLDISVDFPDESTRGPIYFYSVDSVPLDGRDCSVLAIDEFLLQCSSDYPTQKQLISKLQDDISSINLHISNINHEINTIEMNSKDIEDLANMIAQIERNMTNGAGELSQEIVTIEQTIMDAVNERLDLFAAKAPNFNMIDSVSNGNNSSSFFSLNFKDLLSIALLIVNVCLMWYNYFHANSIGKKHKMKGKYAVQYDDEESDAV